MSISQPCYIAFSSLGGLQILALALIGGQRGYYTDIISLSWLYKLSQHHFFVIQRTSPLSHNHGARHAVNPFHAILNYSYAIAESSIRQALVSSGFDISCGFLHADKLYRDSLVYDLMELFRSEVDAKVLKLVQNTTFKKGDFIPMTNGNVRLNPPLARYVVSQRQLPQEMIEQGTRWLKSLL